MEKNAKIKTNAKMKKNERWRKMQKSKQMQKLKFYIFSCWQVILGVLKYFFLI